MPQTPEQDADDEEVMGKIAELAKAVPALRPRMVRLVDVAGFAQRLNLARVSRWWGRDAKLTVVFDDGGVEIFPDKDGSVLDAMDAAFFDVTPADLY